MSATEKILHEEGISGVIDIKHQEFIGYTPQELVDLTDLLNSIRVSIKELADKLNLEIDQVRFIIEKNKIEGVFAQNGDFVPKSIIEKPIIEFSQRGKRISISEMATKFLVSELDIKQIIEKLVKQNKVEGSFTEDWNFIPTSLLGKLIIRFLRSRARKTEKIDISEIAAKFSIAQKDAKRVIQEIGEPLKQVLASISTDETVRIADLSQRTKLSEDFTRILLNLLISENQIAGPVNGFGKDELDEGLVKFTDRHGNERVDTQKVWQKVMEWKKTEIGMQNDFAAYKRDGRNGEREFEKFIAKLLEQMGFEVKLTSMTRDFGADIIAKKEENTFAVQVKLYDAENLIGSPEVQKLGGAMKYYKANRGIFVTTSYFSVMAEEFAKKTRIELWDKKELDKMIKEYLDDLWRTFK